MPVVLCIARMVVAVQVVHALAQWAGWVRFAKPVRFPEIGQEPTIATPPTRTTSL